jgi:hypothetical protein
MLKNKLHYLIGVATGTAFSYGLISAQWLQPAQAAVLTSNFEVDDYTSPDFDGFPHGTFNFDNSSITGQGRELTNVLSGVFNFYKPGFPNKPYAYDLSRGQVNFLDGKFMGLSVSGGVSSDEPMDFRPAFSEGQPILLSFYRRAGWSIEPMEPYGRNILVGQETSLRERRDVGLGRKIVYSEPAEIGTVPVPEPTTIVGTAFAFASLVQLKRKRKNLSGTS